MKLKTALSAIFFVALSANTYAADTEKATPAEMKAAQPAKDAMPHSHVQEKTGVPQKAPTAAPDKKAAQDKTKHYHPRDK
jgi:hypothetical protein